MRSKSLEVIIQANEMRLTILSAAKITVDLLTINHVNKNTPSSQHLDSQDAAYSTNALG